ncbi:MAG TPA: MFS transporter [Lichenihabitans sp.]|jgi:DHA2 family methylenomycin A resistance protein-like MFS transporter|nr:MFS transporter [Lichenihabitans sp.]
MPVEESVRSPIIVLTVVVSSFAFAIVQLDVTVVNVALPRIGTELHANVAALQWVVDAYALVFAVLMLSAGVLGDRIGARKVYVGGMAIFGLASLGCGLAPGMEALVAARAVQGLGAAAMLPTSLTLLNHACGHDAKLRAIAVGWWTAAGSVSIAAGPIVAGLLLGLGTWRSIFLINLPFCLAGLVLAWRIAETEPDRAGARAFDLPGQALAILALTGLIGAVIEARPLGFAHPLVLGGLALFLVCGPLFVIIEQRTPQPLLPIRLFATPAFGIATTYGIAVNLTYYGVVFVLSLYLQRVRGYGATEAGLAYLPLTATFFGVNLLSGWLVGRIGPHWPMALGVLVDALGFGLLLGLGPGSSYWAMLLPFALMPAGMGTGVPAMTVLVLSSVEKGDSGVVSAALNAARQAAGAVGVAIFGALAGEQTQDIVGGLHAGAILAVGLLCAVAVLVVWGTRASTKTVPSTR